MAERFTCEVNEEYRSVCKGLPEYQESGCCVLHFTGEKKEDFDRVIQSKLGQQDYDFRGAVFPDGSSNFEKREFDAAARFAGATFLGTADFTETTFFGTADFTGAKFGKGAIFIRATFCGERTHFSQAQFIGGQNVHFKDTTFFSDKSTEFRGAQFHGQETSFSGAEFKGTRTIFSDTKFIGAQTHFTEVKFSSKWTVFKKAQFSGRYTVFRGARLFSDNSADFTGTKFSGWCTDFTGTKFSNSELTDFKDTEFSGNEIVFSSAEFSSNRTVFSNAKFLSGEEANFSRTQFTGDNTDFTGALFSGAGASFHEAAFVKEVRFTEVTFGEKVYFWGSKENRVFCPEAWAWFDRIKGPEQLTFHSVLLHPGWFINVDMREVDFTDVRWYGMPGGSKGKLEAEIKALEVRGVMSPHTLLSQACRRLSANAEGNREYPLANTFYYWSMNALRKQGWKSPRMWRSLGIIGVLYWAFSGYGVRARRACLMLLGIWAAFTILYVLVPSSPFSGLSAFNFEKATIYSLGALARLNPEPRLGPGWFQLLVTVEGLVGPLQIGLLLLAIRRQVMR